MASASSRCEECRPADTGPSGRRYSAATETVGLSVVLREYTEQDRSADRRALLPPSTCPTDRHHPDYLLARARPALPDLARRAHRLAVEPRAVKERQAGTRLSLNTELTIDVSR